MASIARLLKGNIHEELKERAQRALDESVEAAMVGQQRVDTFQVRLEFHSFYSRLAGKTPEGSRDAAPGGRPLTDNSGQQIEDALFRAEPIGVSNTTSGPCDPPAGLGAAKVQ